MSGNRPSLVEIDYHDLHSTEHVFEYVPVFYKHKAFEHEREMRAFVQNANLPADASGCSYPVKLNDIIQRVVVSPRSPDWFIDEVKTVLSRNGHSVSLPLSPIFTHSVLLAIFHRSTTE